MNQEVQSTATSGHLSVAVVILNWNGQSFLEKFLPSVLASTYPRLEIIVADNASTDSSVSWLKQQYPQIRLIQLDKNAGYAGGYNEALKKVQSDIYVLLNSDVEVTPGWIEPVVQLMQQDETIAACQPKILAYHHKELFEYAGASGGFIDRFGYPFTRGRVFDIIEQDKGQYNDAIPCFWATGAALFIRSKDFHSVGGFDADFFAHQEEIDLCWRLQLAGKKIYVQPLSVVYHVGGGTLPQGNRRKTFLNFRNNLMMLHKNLRGFQAFFIIGFRLMLDGIAAWRALFSKDPGTFGAIFHSHLAYLRWVITAKKQVAQPVAKQHLPGMYRGSVVWDYFIKKKTRFSEIVPGK
ncbi:MAG TPA: glycosyltransferase family 2 protein [Ferruginibacter sp.]|nr:glycosyltransferase family 2 protein [Ferruginibacter sp.]HRO97136.1 glycosyltransferase family 2 protein [Ferruginibacter sp.]HRP50456.1 glycosyltransferase family 2 protein [Ferruginibacter sp.]